MSETRLRFSLLLTNFNYDTDATLSLYHRHNGDLTDSANHGVTLPVTHLLSKLDVHRPIAIRIKRESAKRAVKTNGVKSRTNAP